MRRACKLLIRPFNVFLHLFGLTLIRQAVVKGLLEQNQQVIEENLRMKAVVDGFKMAMEQDYLLIRDIFQPDSRLAVGE